MYTRKGGFVANVDQTTGKGRIAKILATPPTNGSRVAFDAVCAVTPTASSPSSVRMKEPPVRRAISIAACLGLMSE